ncbi:MAG TPA: phospholipase D family protein [Terriglobales bacterium]|nr:phospholipase D family protein [Terriglobales bacterium]
MTLKSNNSRHGGAKMEWIEGPTLPVLRSIGLQSKDVQLVTAFYSEGPLRWLLQELAVETVTVAARLDLKNPSEWLCGSIDPEALLTFLKALRDRGVTVRFFASPLAHAKIFVGDRGVIVGSANLSTRGFGAGAELVRVSGRAEVRQARRSVIAYMRRLGIISIDELERYVGRYARDAREARRNRAARRSPDEDRLPRIRIEGRGMPAGRYDDFVRWLDRQESDAAREIAARARGKGQLSGHIHKNFYGLRQFLLADPTDLRRFAREDEDIYRLSADQETERHISRFVHKNAVDEAEFRLETWRTYLPVECGGKAGKHGGTIGNLNRMLPLVARYLERRQSPRRS